MRPTAMPVQRNPIVIVLTGSFLLTSQYVPAAALGAPFDEAWPVRRAVFSGPHAIALANIERDHDAPSTQTHSFVYAPLEKTLHAAGIRRATVPGRHPYSGVASSPSLGWVSRDYTYEPVRS